MVRGCTVVYHCGPIRVKEANQIFQNLGFPSCTIYDSDHNKIRKHFGKDPDKMNFIVFLLGFILGNESVK
jgi:hypothetical protein